MIELVLKASFAIGIAFLFYKLLLQQESFFTANRFYLVGCLALAFALPFVSLPKLVDQQGYLSSLFQQDKALEARDVTAGTGGTTQAAQAPNQNVAIVLPEHSPETGSAGVGEQVQAAAGSSGLRQTSWMFWLTMLYLFGVVVFSLSLLFQLGGILYKIITATDKIEDGDCVIVNTAGRQAPCSFFKYIFIHPDDYDFETYEQIIAHEKIHARLGHSIDLLLAEIAVIILWFNPLIWLLRREIEKNNEYQTDAILLEKEQVSRNAYQMNLLQIAVPNKPLSITTNYNQSLLKQRIMMMNAKKSTPHAYWKYAFLAPLFFGTILFMNEPATSRDTRQTASLLTPEALISAQASKLSERIIQNIKESLGNSENAFPLAVPQPENGNLEEAMPPMPSLVEPSASLPPLPPAGTPQANQGQRVRVQTGLSMNIQGAQTDMSEGYWYSSREGSDYCIQFKGSKGSSNWNMSRCFNSGLFRKTGNDVFVMTKETGTLQFNGNLDAEVGQGKYTFTEDASFRKYLADNNITVDEKNMMFHLFLGDMNRGYVSFLKTQYSEVSGKRLLELAIHGITKETFQGYVALFEKHSQKKPSIQEVVEARIHGIDEAYVQEIQRMGFSNLSLKKMMEAKIHGVSASYAEGLKNAGFSNLTLDKIISAKIHGIDPAAIKEIQGLGFGKLDLDKMTELKIHGVDAAYIADIKSAGFENLSLDQVLEAKIHGLTAASVKELKALGFKDLSFKDLLTAKIHAVDAAYVADLKKAGFENLSMDKTVEAKIHGIDSGFIAKARQNGYNLNSIDKYISLKIHGMAMESLKEKK